MTGRFRRSVNYCKLLPRRRTRAALERRFLIRDIETRDPEKIIKTNLEHFHYSCNVVILPQYLIICLQYLHKKKPDNFILFSINQLFVFSI